MASSVATAEGGQVLQPGAPVALFTPRLANAIQISAPYAIRPQYAIARDGRFLMNIAIDDGSAPPINIVLNWDAVLRDDRLNSLPQ